MGGGWNAAVCSTQVEESQKGMREMVGGLWLYIRALMRSELRRLRSRTLSRVRRCLVELGQSASQQHRWPSRGDQTHNCGRPRRSPLPSSASLPCAIFATAQQHFCACLLVAMASQRPGRPGFTCDTGLFRFGISLAALVHTPHDPHSLDSRIERPCPSATHQAGRDLLLVPCSFGPTP
jgi:hypothetical protein